MEYIWIVESNGKFGGKAKTNAKNNHAGQDLFFSFVTHHLVLIKAFHHHCILFTMLLICDNKAILVGISICCPFLSGTPKEWCSSTMLSFTEMNSPTFNYWFLFIFTFLSQLYILTEGTQHFETAGRKHNCYYKLLQKI